MEKSVLGLSVLERLPSCQFRKASSARLLQARTPHLVPHLVPRLFRRCFGVELKKSPHCLLLERVGHVDANQNIITIISVFI